MKTTLSDRLFYGIGGGLASNLGLNMMSIFFIIFCVDAWGMSPVVAGTIVLVARLVDTFTDPLMGALADRTRSKLGKYRFWIIIAGPLTGLFTFLVFAAPAIDPVYKTLYMYVIYIGYSVISTAANIPYHSLTAYISDSPGERRSIVIIKQMTGLFTSQLLQFFGIYITITLFNGEIAGYRVLGLISGIIIAVGFIMCAFGARKVDNYQALQNEQDLEKFSFVELLKQLSYIGTNASLRNIAIASSTNQFAIAITGAVSIYFYTIVLGDAKYAQTAAMLGLIFGVVSYLVTFISSNKIGNKETFTIFTIISAVIGVITYVIFDAKAPMFMVIMISVAYGFSKCAELATWMMVTDCADDIKYRTGKNGAGIASSCLTFANKLGIALGGFGSGVILAMIGYDATKTVQDPSVISGLILTMIFAPVVGHICSILAMKGYPLSKDTHQKIHNELFE